MIKKIIIEIRVKQYIKNIPVFLPIIFSFNLFSKQMLLKNIIMFISFCMASSAVYVFNDIADRQKDKLHPTKCKRPIAAGDISVKQGYVMIIFLLAGTVASSAAISLECLLITTVYIVLNVFYTISLKKITILDIACLAAGFILRIAAGSAATGVPFSNWLFLTITALSFFLGFGKRKSEYRVSSDNETRDVLSRYSKDFLNSGMYAMMSISIVFYSLWTIDSKTMESFGSNYLIYTTFLVIIALLRYALASEISGEGDPSDIIWKDKPLHIIIIIYAATVLFMGYL